MATPIASKLIVLSKTPALLQAAAKISTSSVLSLWSGKDKGSAGKGHDQILNEITKETLDNTLKQLEKVLRDMDTSMGSIIRDAEHRLGADGFFDRLRNLLNRELAKGHRQIADIDLGKIGKLSASGLRGSASDRIQNIGHFIGFFGGDKVDVIPGNIPPNVDEACKRPTAKDWAIDVSLLLSDFASNEITSKVHGNVLAVEGHKIDSQGKHDALIEFQMPENIDKTSIKVYRCINKNRVVIYGHKK